MKNVKRHMHKRLDDRTKLLILVIALLMMVLGMTFLIPERADAWPSKFASCIAASCHGTADPNATIYTAIDGVDHTPVTQGDPITLNVVANQTFEVDYYFQNATEVSGGYGVGVLVVYPTGWTVQNGTAASAPSTGNFSIWSSSWDLADGVGWSFANPITDTNGEYPGTEGYTIRYDGTGGWDTGNRDTACDEGVNPCVTDNGGDFDLMSETMGTDVRITVPGGTADGTYTLVVIGVGHDNGKTSVQQLINVNVGSANAAPTLTVNQPDGVGDTVTQGTAFNINYDLADTDDTVTAAFYYDTNNTGLDGTAISGACATAAEGTGLNCSWDTTGVTPGNYYVYGITNDGTNPPVDAYSSGQITINAPNAPPTLTVTQPDGAGDTVVVGDPYNVTYDLADSDNVVTAAFYYDSDAVGLDGTAITGACATAAEGTGVTCSWDTTGVTPGSYYVYGITDDGVNPQVSDYSPGQITINAANASPTLTVTQPDGTGDTVTVGDPFSITYDLADSDNVVTAAFYYDTDAVGLDGVAITGACATAAEGTGATCSWDTTGMTPGSYYVYGITDDGVNPQVSDYSPGQITINAPNASPTLTVTQPDGTGDTVTVGDPYSVTYDLADSDNVVTAAFYYDTDMAGLDGVAITGACATAAEGTGATCSWDTTGMTPGSYYVYGITDDGVNPQVSDYSPGQITINGANVSPTLTVNQPDGVSDTIGQNGSYDINYDLADPDNVVTVAFYYDSDNVGLDGTAISGACSTGPEGSGVICAWDTNGVTPGSYYIYGITDDGVNPQVSDYSSGQVTINALPTLNVTQPDGTADTIAQDGLYSVTYDLADSDDVVTVAFYYDTDNIGLDGTVISGACATGAEGTGATCSWDTNGVTPGAYYVYGIVNDGVNPQVSDYSLGQVTINAAPTLTVNQPDGVGDTIAQDGLYSIDYDLADTDDVVTVAFYYDTDNIGLDGTGISGACATGAEGTGVTCSWDTNGVAPGNYYVYGIVNDGINGQVDAYSSGQVTINAAPTLTVNQPDGVGDTIVQDGLYSIDYDLADTDDVVTVAFYYDTDNIGLDGTVISGACATGAEGTGATCSWDTNGVAPGNYYVYGIVNDGTNGQVDAYSSGQITINAIPTLSISQPDGTDDTVVVGDPYNVTYDLADGDDVITVAFYYDTNNTGLDGVAITGACATGAEGTGATCSWDTTAMTPGSYYVYGITNDGTNPQVDAYSTGQITINASNATPTLTVSQPDGTGDTVVEGDSYNITYDLDDIDNVVTAAFYYDNDAVGLDGTAISGACATAAEGTGVTCSWNTTGVTPGSYYVYGITDDGVNPQVSDYSPGQITINANVSPTLTVNDPDGVSDTVIEGASYNINYDLADADNVVTAAFYYDTDNIGLDGTAISGACATAAEGTGVTCAWDTTGVTPGSYYVYGITNDGVNPQVSDYSSGQITINANQSPTLTVTQPDGVGDSVTVGDPYSVTYDLADADDVVTAAFYYDSDNIGLDGTAISGACATAAEGAGATCSWDTTGVTPGSYYVYGITNDGVNPQVSDYSSGQITINAPDLTDPTTAVTDPADASYINSADADPYSIQGTADDNVAVQGIEVSIDGGTWTAASCTGCPGASVTWTYSWNLPTDGSYTVQSRATDTSSNQGVSTVNNVTVDRTGPTVGAAATNILTSGELTDNVAWQEQTSSPSLVLSENAQEIVITIDTQTGSDPSAITDLWVDDVSIVYVPDPPPVSSVTDPTDLSYLNASAADPYSINGSATDNTAVEKIEVSINGGAWTEAVCTGCPGTSVTWSYSWTLPADGSYTIQSRAIDSSTNIESPSAGISVTVDRADPASSVTDPADLSTLNASAPDPYTASGSASDNEGVASIEFFDGSSWQPAVCTGCPGTSVTWTYSWTLPGDGGYTVNSRATDSAGNVETPGAGNSVTISRTGPSVVSTNPSDGASGVTPDSSVTITFDTDTINCATVDATTITSDSPGWTFSTCQSDQPIVGQTLATYTTSGQNSATTYNVNVTTGVQDNIGNPTTPYAFSYTTTDADPPSSSITDPADAVTIDGNAPDPLNITGTATDNVVVSSVEVSINGGAWNPAVCTGCPGENVVWSYAWTLPGDGSYTIQSRAIDNSSNQETPGAGNTVSVDRSLPVSTITTPADGTYLAAGDYPYSVTGSATDTNTNITGIEVSTDGGNSWTATVCTGCPGTNVTWSYSWAVPTTEGSYVIRVRATDVASNVEVPSPGNTATYDGTSPAVAATSPANTATDVATDRDVTITFTEANLDCTTVNTTNITSNSPGWTLSNCDDVTGVVTFATSGQANYTTYNMNVTTAVADKSGNTLASAYPFSYTVGTANTVPGNPTNLRQYKTDDATQIGQGTTTDETSVVIWADVTDTDADNVLIEAEIVLNASSFSGTANCTIGDAVVTPGTAKVTCGNLTDGADFKWRIRSYDGKDYSSWIAYGGNPDVTIVTPLNTSVMLHNSTNTASSKWGGSWGVQGGQYGEFVCETCHTDSTTNIKRIKQSIVAPNSPTHDFPGSSVTFTDPREGTADFGDDMDPTGHSTSTKVCEVCHTQTKYHNFNTANNTGGLDHNNQRNCMQCHYHKEGFKPSGSSGTCTGCHDGVPGTTYVSRDVMSGDFTQASRHIFGGTPTNWDCIVCHMEGDENDAVSGTITTTSYHPFSNGKVDLRDVDNPGTRVVEWDKNNVTDAMHTGMDTFCMKCHDSDSSRGAGQGGASGIAVATGDGGVTLSPTLDERMKPFNSTDGLDAGTGGGTYTLAGYERTEVLDAYGQFDPTNESHHAVRGQAYSSHNANWDNLAWVNRTLKNGTTLYSVHEAATLHCADCHTTDVNAHGGSNGFMLQASSIDGTCWLCHSDTEYSNNSSNSVRWRHDNDSNTWDPGDSSKIGAYNGNHGSYCRTCHGGNIGEGGSFIDGYGGMHGMDTGLTGVDSRSGQPRYRFQGGIYMSHDPGSWTGTSGGTPTCYFSANKTIDWSNCGQHNSNQTGRTDLPQYSRGTPGQY